MKQSPVAEKASKQLSPVETVVRRKTLTSDKGEVGRQINRMLDVHGGIGDVTAGQETDGSKKNTDADIRLGNKKVVVL